MTTGLPTREDFDGADHVFTGVGTTEILVGTYIDGGEPGKPLANLYYGWSLSILPTFGRANEQTHATLASLAPGVATLNVMAGFENSPDAALSPADKAFSISRRLAAYHHTKLTGAWHQLQDGTRDLLHATDTHFQLGVVDSVEYHFPSPIRVGKQRKPRFFVRLDDHDPDFSPESVVVTLIPEQANDLVTYTRNSFSNHPWHFTSHTLAVFDHGCRFFGLALERKLSGQALEAELHGVSATPRDIVANFTVVNGILGTHNRAVKKYELMMAKLVEVSVKVRATSFTIGQYANNVHHCPLPFSVTARHSHLTVDLVKWSPDLAEFELGFYGKRRKLFKTMKKNTVHPTKGSVQKFIEAHTYVREQALAASL